MMMMRKTILFLTILIGSLLIAGCNSETGTTKPSEESVFIGGSEGLLASFEPLGVLEDGTYTIYNTEDFPLEILLKNKGEETIPAEKVSLRLLGPPKADFQNIPVWTITNKKEIEKISEFNPEGGEEVVTFTPSGLALYTGNVVGSVPINWNVEYAYDYKTHVVINDVCFKGDPSDKKVCTVKESKTFHVSGAPITVNSVEEDSGGKGIMMLRINLKNGGEGSSTLIDGEFDSRFSQVGYEIDEPEVWECKSGGREGQARFVDGAAQVICKTKNPLAEDDLYTKTVSFTLNYKYKELIQEKLRIKESVS